MSGVCPHVLIADDEAHIRRLLAHWLEEAGYCCTTASDGAAALEAVQRGAFSLLVSDLTMPELDGMELLRAVREQSPDLAVLMVTAVDDRETAIRALELGAYGYVTKPFSENEILINVTNAVERRRLMLTARAHERDLEEQVRARTAELRRREEAIALHLLSAAELRDDETGGHVRRIGLLSAALAEALGLDTASADDLRLTAPMHDIGKIGIPDHILRKPGPLDVPEVQVMRTHTSIGADVLHDPEVPLLRLAAEVARTHHERWDGNGYPEALEGEAIPLPGRLVSIVDVYDALTHDRCYRPALPEAEALKVIAEGRGTHFDPDVHDCFMECLPDFRQISQELPEVTAG